MPPPNLRIGLFGIGLEAYWPQFDGLKERLESYLAKLAVKLARPGAIVVNLGLVDNPDRAFSAGREFQREGVDLIFLHVTTYALSSTVLPVVLRAKVPVIVLNLAPTPAINYAAFNALEDRIRMTGDWLAHCSACPVPEIANVFNRAGVRFFQITGVLEDDPQCWDEVDAWVEAGRVAAGLFGHRVGSMGHYYGGMLDIHTDVTLMCATFGSHIEHLEVDELSAVRRTVTAAEIDERLAHLRTAFDVQPDCPLADLSEAARTSVALDRMVAAHRLDSLAFSTRGPRARTTRRPSLRSFSGPRF